MLKNYVLISWRNIIKHKSFLLINTLGLGIAIACCVVAYLNWNFNYEFDSNQKNCNNVYRINSFGGYAGQNYRVGTVPLPLAKLILENDREVSKSVRYIIESSSVLIKADFFPIAISYVDQDFFNLFSFEFESGSIRYLEDKSKIFIREDLARKYFGNEDPLGKQITHFIDNESKEYIIAGVFKRQPDNSSFSSIEAIVNYDSFFLTHVNQSDVDWNLSNTTFVEIPNLQNAHLVSSGLNRYVSAQNEASKDFKVQSYYLEPFNEMAENAQKFKTLNHHFRSNLPTAAVVGPSILALFMILIACFNFTNTTIAMSGKRLREIGIRKTLGGQRSQLIFQFFFESFIFCIIALIAGLIFSEFLIPQYNEMWQFVYLEIKYSFRFLSFIIFLLAIVSILAGSYPAIYISRYQPIDILRGKLKFKSDNYFIHSLLTVQLAISVVAIIASVAFIRNANFQKSMDYGFNIEGIAYVPLQNPTQAATYKNSLSEYSNILKVTGTKHHIMNYSIFGIIQANGAKDKSDYFEISHDYAEVMGIKLLEGRNFIENSENDRLNSIIVNETFLKTFQLKNPIGTEVLWMDTVRLSIIGVVKDFYNGAFREPIKPVVFRLAPESDYNFIVVKSDKSDLKEVGESMRFKWRQLFPFQYYNGRVMEDNLMGTFKVNRNILSSFIFLGILTTLLSAAGLYNILSFNIFDRTKEIGIRKAFGGDLWGIAVVVNKKYIVIFLISMILGSLAGGYIIGFLLNMIWVYHTQLDYSLFAMSIFALTTVILITISGKVIDIARINPAESLRSE